MAKRREHVGVGEAPGRLIVLGSGADVDCGLPTMSTLMAELALYVRGAGEHVDRALRRKLPYLRFTFDKFAGDRGDELLAQLFSAEEDVSARLRSAAAKLKQDEDLRPIATLVQQLCDMARENRLTGASLQGVAHMAGEIGQVGDAEPVLDPAKLSFTHIVAGALRTGFQEALLRGPTLTAEERETLELFVTATSNIEQLLSHYFVGYLAGHAAEQKTYLYLAWVLWAFLHTQSSRRTQPADSIYARLPRLGADVVTFNYTNFFEPSMLRRVRFFHGRLDRVMGFDTRELVPIQLRHAGREGLAIDAFLESLRLDVKSAPAIDVPAIVPPTTFKPVMSREQLRTWIEADDLLQSSQLVVIVGYSFGMADEHFNDLLRKSNPRNRVVVVNPEAETVGSNAARVLGLDPARARRTSLGSLEVWHYGRLLAVNARAAEVTSEFIEAVSSSP